MLRGGVLYNGTAFAMNFFGVHERTENREVYYNADGSIQSLTLHLLKPCVF
jgi:hypothetical protein